MVGKNRQRARAGKAGDASREVRATDKERRVPSPALYYLPWRFRGGQWVIDI